MDQQDEPKSPGDGGQWQFKTDDSGASDQQPDPEVTATQVDQDNTVPAGTGEYMPPVAQPFAAPASPNDSVSWTASEFIAHQKSVGWYAMLALIMAVAALLVYLITKDKISTGVVVLVAILFGISAARKPRTLPYLIDSAGLHIGDKVYAYKNFRSFAVLDEEAFSSIVFMPLKRFMPMITIYFDPKDGQKITGILGARLPMETHKLDLVDQLMHRIRF